MVERTQKRKWQKEKDVFEGNRRARFFVRTNLSFFYPSSCFGLFIIFLFCTGTFNLKEKESASAVSPFVFKNDFAHEGMYCKKKKGKENEMKKESYS